MGKKRKHEENGTTSMPRDGMPLEGTSDAFPSSSLDVLIQLKDIVQVKVNTDDCLQKLEETVKKLEETVKQLEEKVKRLKKKLKKNKIKESEMKEQIKEVKEDLKRELMQRIEEKVENISNEYFQKHLEEVKEEPYIEIQEEMDKERSAKVNRCSASPSLRSQPHQSQATSFHLEFACEMDAIVYKGKPILAIQVVLYDGDNPIAPNHHLASAVVELVVVDGEFSGQIQGYWSKDEFVQNIMKSRQGNNSQGETPKVPVKNGRFKLDGGRCCHKGAVIMENSNRKDVKLGVMIAGSTKERVLEGISNSFSVQEAKTAEKRGKRITDETPEDLPRFTGHNSTHARNKKGSSSVGPLPLEPPQYPTQRDTTQPESNGQGQQYMPTKQNFPPMLNQLQRTDAHITGNGPVGQPVVVCVQQQNTNQKENHGNGFVGSLPLDPLKYLTQHDISRPESYGNGTCDANVVFNIQQHNTTQQEDHGQGQQYSYTQTPQNFAIMPNQLQGTHARTTGNGLGGPPVVINLQQRTTTREHYAGEGQEYSIPETGPIISQNVWGSVGITYPYTEGKCFAASPPLLEPSEYPTQQDTTQFGSYGAGSGCCASVCVFRFTVGGFLHEGTDQSTA
uniref:Uncharacterized protein n=1 Tax=Avena sativa TaxID=4498 RepID=A0ACD6AEK7_AVESA